MPRQEPDAGLTAATWRVCLPGGDLCSAGMLLKAAQSEAPGKCPPLHFSRARLVSATVGSFRRFVGSASCLVRDADISPLLPAARVRLPYNHGRRSLFLSSPLLTPSCSSLSSVWLPHPPLSGGAWWRRGRRRASRGSRRLLLLLLAGTRVVVLVVFFFLKMSGWCYGWLCLFAWTWAYGGRCFVFPKPSPASSLDLLPPPQAANFFLLFDPKARRNLDVGYT